MTDDERMHMQKKMDGRYAYAAVTILLICIGIVIWGEMAIQRLEPVDVVVNTDQSGQVLVVYGVKGGSPTQYEGNRRIYEVPDSRILFTQFAANPGVSLGSEPRLRYFVKEASGDLRQISGEYGVQMGTHALDPCEVVYDVFVIGSVSSPTVNKADPIAGFAPEMSMKCVEGVLMLR